MCDMREFADDLCELTNEEQFLVQIPGAIRHGLLAELS